METIEKMAMLRHALKQSQDELAQSIGLTQTQICRYESGKNDMSVKTLNKILGYWRITELEFHSLGIIPLRNLIMERAEASKKK